MKKRRKNSAVSDIVATALLLGIAIGLFAVVQMIALSFPFNPNPPSARLVGSVDGNTIFIYHHGGETLLLNDTKVIFIINGNSEEHISFDIQNFSSYNNDDFWNIGEKLYHNPLDNLNDAKVNIIVIDLVTNSIIMNSRIQE
jgi:hypothetical protein